MKAPEFNTYIVDDFKAFQDLMEYEASLSPGVVCIDIETNSAQERVADLYGIGVCFDNTTAFYIVVRDNKKKFYWHELQYKNIKNWLIHICKRHKLVNHNIIYDTLVLEYTFGYDFSQHIYSDTILQKHCVDEERPFKLKEVAVQYLGEWADNAQDELYKNIEANGGSTNKDNVEMWKADVDVIATYCCWDVLLTRRLFDLFENELHKEGLQKYFYEEEVMPLYKLVTIPMKRKGLRIDLEHFKTLQKDIKVAIDNLEEEILNELPMVETFVKETLNKKYPIKRTGKFPQYLANNLSVGLPKKDGKTTLAKKALVETLDHDGPFYRWIVDNEDAFAPEMLQEAQLTWFFEDNPEHNSVFNLKSNDHLGWLLFDHFKEKPLHKTPGGSPQCDDDFLEHIADKYYFVPKLIEYKKLIKLSTTYIDGVLERQINGYIYPSFLQFGTTSGRYSCISPNLQNQPRQKEDEEALSPLILKYTNAIRAGYIADEGGVIVDLDQSQLEPRAFATASGDAYLQDIFKSKEDFYAGIAKRVFNLPCSASEVKKLYPVQRQTAKTIALAVAYGAEAHRIAGILKIPTKEAQAIIDDYMTAAPGLKKYIAKCHYDAKTKGQVRTMFGRIRHLPMAKYLHKKYGDELLNYMWARQRGLTKERKMYKNALNNSTNNPIQGLAAHIMNRSSIEIAKRLKERNLKATIAGQIHDQLIIPSDAKDAEEVMKIAKECLENTVQLEVPLIAVGKIAQNLAESH